MDSKLNNNYRGIYNKLALSFLLYMVVSQSLAYVLEISGITFFQSGIGSFFKTFGSMYLVAFPIFLLVTKKIPDTFQDTSKATTNFKAIDYLKYFFLIKLASMVGVIISSTIFSSYLLKIVSLVEPTQKDTSSVVELIFPFLLGGFIGPIIEEMIFRKIPFKKLGQGAPFTFIIFSSLCFGLFHLNPLQGFSAGFAGIIFSYVMIKYKNILYPIILHILMNVSLELVNVLEFFNLDKIANIIDKFNKFSPFVGLVLFIYLLIKKMIKKEKWLTIDGNILYALFNIGAILFITYTVIQIALTM